MHYAETTANPQFARPWFIHRFAQTPTLRFKSRNFRLFAPTLRFFDMVDEPNFTISPTLRFLQLYDFPTLRFSNFTIQWHARPYQGFHRRTLPLTLTLVICCYFLESFIPIIHCHLNRYLKRAPLHPRGKLLRVQALRHPAIHHRRSCLHLPTGSELRRLAAGRCRGAKG